MQSSLFRLVLLVILALGVLLLLRPGTMSQLRTLAENFSSRHSSGGQTPPDDRQPAAPSSITVTPPPITATAPAALLGQSGRPNSGESGETNVCDDARGAEPEPWPPPLEITVPPLGPDGQPVGEKQVEDGPDLVAAAKELSESPTPPPNNALNPLRDIPPPPVEQNGGPTALPQDAGFAPAAPSIDLPPPPNQPPPADRPPSDHTADAYRPAPVSPQVASGPIQEAPPASRPQAPPSYVPPLLEPIRTARLDPRGPSSSPGAPGSGTALDAGGSAGTLGGPAASATDPHPTTSPDAAGPIPGIPGPAPGAANVAPGAANLTPAAPGSAASGPSTPGSVSSGDLPASDKQLCKGAEKVAQVGSQVILASDLNVAFNTWVENQKKSKKPLTPEQIRQYRTDIEVTLLKQMTEEIVIYQDVVRQVPEEGLKHVREKVAEVFETEELPKRIKNAGVGSRAEFDEKLEKMGTSLEREKRTYIQSLVAQQWLHQQIKSDDETFTPEEIFAYYREHIAEFEHPARVKWEELMVRKSRHPNRDQALGLLGRLGNQVFDGAKFSEVARAGSEGATARDGGLHDWTAKGSLVSEALEGAIFSLPMGQLSRIIETDLGYHIVRVMERQDQSVTPFLEAQVDIRKKITEQRKKKQIDEYLAKLHARTPVWTKYDALIAQQQKASQKDSPLLFER